MAIQIRRGTNAEWESNNSNIVVGEPAIATDEERFFVGTDSGAFAEFANLYIIAPAYDTSTSYEVGDVINRQGKLYSCNTPCSGAFNATYWDEKSLTEILKDLENKIDYAQYEIGYADGELITIENGASEIPVKDLKFGIEAVQDLHGYDAPWVGGAGKNKCDYDTAFSAFKVSENNFSGLSNATGFSGVKIYIPSELVGQQLTWSAYLDLLDTDSPSHYLVLASEGGTEKRGAAVAKRTAEYSSVTFTPTSTSDYVSFTWGSGTGTIKIKDIQLEIGAERTAWQPYTNICPISGWTGCEVSVDGFNLFDEDMLLDASGWNYVNGYYTGGSNTLYGEFNENGSLWENTKGYTGRIFFTYTGRAESAGGGSRFRFVYTDGTYSDATSIGTTDDTITLASNASKTVEKIVFVYSSLRTIYLKNVCINFWDESKNGEYAPYNGTTYSVTWQTEAGTVYGGTLDVTTGVLTIDKGYATIDNNWSESINRNSINATNVFYDIKISGSKTVNNTDTETRVTCDEFEKTYASFITTSQGSADRGGKIALISSNRILACMAVSLGVTTASDFRTWLSSNPIHIVYELATPQTYQLTPTQVRTLLGTNNLWNSMNSNNELAYRISNALN